MASSSSKNSHHIRSISFPTESHAATLQVEEKLYHLKTWEASTSTLTPHTICTGLTGLGRLYKYVDDLLSSPLTQQALSHEKHEKLVDELLDRSMRLLEVCGSIRDVILQIKEHVRDVQSALRRRKEDIICINTSFTKKLKKDVKRANLTLKQVNNKIGGTPFLDANHHLSSVIKTLRDVSAVSISVFGLLLSFMSVSVPKSKSSKWSKVSRLINKGTTGSKDQHHISNDVECHIEGIENSVEGMYRMLIKTRANLLNILSH